MSPGQWRTLVAKVFLCAIRRLLPKGSGVGWAESSLTYIKKAVWRIVKATMDSAYKWANRKRVRRVDINFGTWCVHRFITDLCKQASKCDAICTVMRHENREYEACRRTMQRPFKGYPWMVHKLSNVNKFWLSHHCLGLMMVSSDNGIMIHPILSEALKNAHSLVEFLTGIFVQLYQLCICWDVGIEAQEMAAQ